MPNTDYAFMSAYLKGQESKAITPDHIGRMAKVSNIQEVLRIIADTDIGSYLEEVPAKDLEDIDECLWVYFDRCLSRLQWLGFLTPDMLKISSAYVAKYDVFNTKAALQSILTAQKAKMIPMGIIHSHGLTDELSHAENIDDIIELLTKCKLENYIPALKGYEVGEGAKSRLLAEARLDSEYYRSMLSVAQDVKDGPILAKAFGLIIDLINLQIVSRAIIEGMGGEAAEYTIAGGYILPDKVAAELLSLKLTDAAKRLQNTQYQDIANEVSTNYDKTKSITAVEETIDKHKFRMLKELLSPRVLSPLVMAWYLILKEVEIRNLRLVLKAIVDGVPVPEIKDFLVL